MKICSAHILTFMHIKSIFLFVKGFAWGLVPKQRDKVTQKWPIGKSVNSLLVGFAKNIACAMSEMFKELINAY